ncbi:MAG TPA: SRPBCC domain-containing protein [Candidatus Acidoferrum sp.]|nr:SRPBCC domain-containing protein [Candidatus Acidoferrum sp.]
MTYEADPNDATESVVLECDLPEPPAKVWKALTEPALLAAWLLPNDIRPEPGARFAFQADAEAGGGTIECEVLDVDAPRLLRYSWRAADAGRDARDRALDSVVTFVLAETADGGTHLRLIHDGFPADALQQVASLAMATPKVVSLDRERLRRRASPITATVRGGLRWAA